MDFVVKTLDSQEFPVKIKGDSLVEELRIAVFNAGGPPAGLQRLVVRGKPMEDGKTLREYGITDPESHTIHLVIKSAPPQPQMILKNSDGRIIVIAFDPVSCLLVKDVIELAVKKDEHLESDNIILSLPTSVELLPEQTLKELGLSQGGSLRISSQNGVIDVMPQQDSVETPSASSVQKYHLSDEMFQFLDSEHLSDYAECLSRSGIRTFQLLCECTADDLPNDLPKPVRRLLLSKVNNFTRDVKVVPSAPPAIDQTDDWITDMAVKQC